MLQALVQSDWSFGAFGAVVRPRRTPSSRSTLEDERVFVGFGVAVASYCRPVGAHTDPEHHSVEINTTVQDFLALNNNFCFHIQVHVVCSGSTVAPLHRRPVYVQADTNLSLAAMGSYGEACVSTPG